MECYTACGKHHQLVVPASLREKVLQELHGSVTAGHFGIAKTYGRVQQCYYWVNCRDDVLEWCRNCDVCAERRGPPRRQRAAMQQYLVRTPTECLALYVLGPLLCTRMEKHVRLGRQRGLKPFPCLTNCG